MLFHFALLCFIAFHSCFSMFSLFFKVFVSRVSMGVLLFWCFLLGFRVIMFEGFLVGCFPDCFVFNSMVLLKVFLFALLRFKALQACRVYYAYYLFVTSCRVNRSLVGDDFLFFFPRTREFLWFPCLFCGFFWWCYIRAKLHETQRCSPQRTKFRYQQCF